MTARRLAYLLGIAVLVSSGIYVFVYLYRWEWNRAMFAGITFVITETVLLGAIILERLRTLGAQVDEVRRNAVDPRVLARLRQAAPPRSQPFAWLRPDGTELGVFVPVLMGAGVVLSGLAWLVERLARRTATPVLEKGLARRLGTLALPDSLLEDAGDDSLTLLRGPVSFG